MTENCDVKKGCDAWFYSDIIKDHFFHPRNILTSKEDIDKFKADGVGQVGSPACGDVMKMWIKVKDNKIIACKWQTFGCASAIASTSILSEMVVGMNLDKAMGIKPKDIAEKLGGLPANKFHCSILGDKALRAAIEDYKSKNN